MAIVQNTFSENSALGFAGMVANGETSNRITRTAEAAGGIDFGKAAFRGAGDHGCLATQTLVAASAALGTNTGNGAMGAITVSAGAFPGRYTLTIIEPAANAGNFTVTDPNGVQIGDGTVAAAFSAGGLAFTLTDGSTDFVAGDSFAITVSGNDFLGITIANEALQALAGETADKYQRYDSVAIATQGVVWVVAGGDVTDGADVFVDSNGDFVVSGGIPAIGWKFDTTGADGALVKIAKR